MTEIIHLKNVSMTRSKRKVLSRINWVTYKGEHWFIMGPNGSGKTTLVEILMGYLWPQKGEVRVLGELFGRVNLQELRAKVGYVSPWIFRRMPPETPVKDVVASGYDSSVGLFGRQSPAIKRAVLRQLRFFDCMSLQDRAFGMISSGQQFKVILARALVHQPALLILDEPFSLLDIGARMEMYRLLTRLAKRSRAPQLLLVTHHREDLLPVFDRGLILKNGRIHKQGCREDVLTPLSLASAFGIPAAAFRGTLFPPGRR
jgi:iron complex transport system ATP-binding protein